MDNISQTPLMLITGGGVGAAIARLAPPWAEAASRRKWRWPFCLASAQASFIPVRSSM